MTPALPSCCSELDRHFAQLIERLAGGNQPEVALAAALASFYRAQGHICLDLKSVAGRRWPEEEKDPAGTTVCPALDRWLASLRTAPVVGAPGEVRPLILDGYGRLYLHRYWDYETALATEIKRRATLESTPAAFPSESLDRLFPPDSGPAPDWQRVAALTAARTPLCVISGGPGTGKTRTVVRILALLAEAASAEGKRLRFAVAAPTGKAAARIQEELRRAKEQLPCAAEIKARLPDEAMTLHRLLGAVPDSAAFRHDAKNPLPADVVVVDEASMVDLALMAKLFAAARPSAKVILLGDKDQLASVEAGAVLGDICGGMGRGEADREAEVFLLGKAAVPLTPALSPGKRENQVQSVTESDPRSLADGPRAALPPHEPRNDERPPHPAPLPLRGGEGAVSAGEGEHGSAQDSRSVLPVASCIVQLRKNYRFGETSAIHRLSAAINTGDVERARAVLDESRQAIGEVSWTSLPRAAQLRAALRDKLLAEFGPYLAATEPRAALEALGRFRILCAVREGPFGVARVNELAEEILEAAGLIRRTDPWYAHRPVMVTRNDYRLRLFNGDVGAILPDPQGRQPRACFSGAENEVRQVLPARLPACETVYAMTVHKSQGSEFERVLLILPDRDSPLLTRELLYTGLTRARGQVELWCDETIFRAAVGRRMERSSGLREALWGLCRTPARPLADGPGQSPALRL